jgi:hypothetical protein
VLLHCNSVDKGDNCEGGLIGLTLAKVAPRASATSERGNSLSLDVTFGLFRVVTSWVEKFEEALNDWVQIRNESISCNAFTKID